MSLLVLYVCYFLYCLSPSFSRCSMFSFLIFFLLLSFASSTLHCTVLSIFAIPFGICSWFHHFAEPLNASTICIILSFYFFYRSKQWKLTCPKGISTKDILYHCSPSTMFILCFMKQTKYSKNHTQLHCNNNDIANEQKKIEALEFSFEQNAKIKEERHENNNT